MTGEQKNVLATACASHGLIHVFELAAPALLIPIQFEFGASDASMGMVVGLYALLFGLGSLPAGFLVDRFGAKPLLLACLWGGSLGVAGMALAPTLALFTASAALMGLSISIYHPAGTALISQALPATGRVFALHGMAGNTGIALSALLAGVLGELIGWRQALAALSVIGILIGLRVAAFRFGGRVEQKPGEVRGRWAAFVLLLVAASFMGMVYRGFTTFLPKLLATRVEGEVASTALGGTFTSISMVVGLVGMYLSGKLIDRGRSPIAVFLLATVCQAPFLVAMSRIEGAGLVPAAMGIAFFHFMTQPAGNQLVARITPESLRGMGYGIYFFAVFGLGAAGASYAGTISETTGIAAMFPWLAPLLAPCVLAMLAMRRAARG